MYSHKEILEILFRKSKECVVTFKIVFEIAVPAQQKQKLFDSSDDETNFCSKRQSPV